MSVATTLPHVHPLRPDITLRSELRQWNNTIIISRLTTANWAVVRRQTLETVNAQVACVRELFVAVWTAEVLQSGVRHIQMLLESVVTRELLVTDVTVEAETVV